MNKFWLLLLIPGITFGAITQGQVDQVKSIDGQIVTVATQMQDFARVVGLMVQNGYTYTVNFSTIPVGITAQQQQDMINYYSNLKGQLQTLITQLP